MVPMDAFHVLHQGRPPGRGVFTLLTLVTPHLDCWLATLHLNTTVLIHCLFTQFHLLKNQLLHDTGLWGQ